MELDPRCNKALHDELKAAAFACKRNAFDAVVRHVEKVIEMIGKTKRRSPYRYTPSDEPPLPIDQYGKALERKNGA